MKSIFGVIGMVVGLLFVLAIAYMVLTGINSEGESILGSTKTVSKKIVGIYEGPSYDIVFSLQGDENIYYINRGLQHGLNIAELKSGYLGKELSISYVSFFNSKGGHINRIRHGDSMVYNELKEE